MFSRVLLCVWHSSLTVHQNNALERIQRVCLKLILGKDYVEYINALGSCELLWTGDPGVKKGQSLLQRNVSLPWCSSPTWTPIMSTGAVSCQDIYIETAKPIIYLFYSYLRMMITIWFCHNKSLFIYLFINICTII